MLLIKTNLTEVLPSLINNKNSYEQIAAVDLGSNSFRLQIARILDGQIYSLDSLKEPVRLAAGLTPDKRLDTESQERGLVALRRFGERLRGFQPGAVRVVATNTLRVAKNAGDFLPLAEEALGFPIEIISGREEARLIYIGAVHSLPSVHHKRLVIDIGGGSTEFIIGQKIEPQLMESLYMGCVSYTMRFFPGGKVNRKRFRTAETAAAQEIEIIARNYRRLGWQEVVGTSGSARAISDILELNQLNPNGKSGITRQGLENLCALMIRAGSAKAMTIKGLPSDRIPVLPGALTIMSAIFSGLGIEQMNYADGALRQGVQYDFLGRFQHRDIRDSTVLQFMHRYQIDQRQAERVRKTALGLLGQLINIEAPEHENDLRFLRWAVDLHEIGISISHSGFHKHGAFILGFSDMPGFSKKDQSRLAHLVLGQRGKLEKLIALPHNEAMWHLVLCLRIAVALHRSRTDHTLPTLKLEYGQQGYQLDVPETWLTHNPLSAASLSDEAIAWQRIGLKLGIRRRTKSASNQYGIFDRSWVLVGAAS